MGCRGMKGPIGKGSNETWWQSIKRTVYNHFWPRSEQVLDFFAKRKSDSYVYDKDGKAIGVRGKRGPGPGSKGQSGLSGNVGKSGTIGVKGKNGPC